MTNIKNSHPSQKNQEAVALDGVSLIQVEPNKNFSELHCSTVASCKDYPPAIHAAKALFIEVDQEEFSKPRQEQQIKEKANFIKLLSFDHLRKELSQTTLKFKDTLSIWKENLRDFFGKDVSKKNAISKKSEMSQKNKAQKIAEVEPVSPINKDRDSQRIKDIEDAVLNYAVENAKPDGNPVAMLELLQRIDILVRSLSRRYSKREIEDIFKHMEANIVKRVKTYRGSKTWTYISMGIYGATAVLSFASIGGHFIKGDLGNTLKGLGEATKVLEPTGQVTHRVEQMKQDERAALQEELKFVEDKLKLWRDEGNRKLQDDRQHEEQIVSLIREAIRNHTQAVQATTR